MYNCLMYTLIGAGATLYTFFVWNIGFTQGADVAMCLTEHYVGSEKPLIEIEACGRMRSNSPFYFLRAKLPEVLK